MWNKYLRKVCDLVMSNMQSGLSIASFGIWAGSGAVSAKMEEEFDKFRYLSIFDHVANTRNIVEKTKYTVAPGGTIITLRESFLETLADGKYDFHARFIDGNVKLELTVDRSIGISAPQVERDVVQCCDDTLKAGSDDAQCCDKTPQYDDYDDEGTCCCGFSFDIEDCRRLALPIAILALCVLVFAGTKCYQKSVKRDS